MIGSPALLSTFDDQPHLERQAASNDDDLYAQVLKMNREKDFTWVELTTVSEGLAAQRNNGSEVASNQEKARVCFKSRQQFTISTNNCRGNLCLVRYSQACK
jgi:hypothetical protein